MSFCRCDLPEIGERGIIREGYEGAGTVVYYKGLSNSAENEMAFSIDSPAGDADMWLLPNAVMEYPPTPFEKFEAMCDERGLSLGAHEIELVQLIFDALAK